MRVFERALEEKPRDRAEIVGDHVATQSQCFQRNGPSTRKRIKNPRCASTVGVADFLAKPVCVWGTLIPPPQNPALGLNLVDLNGAAILGLTLLLGNQF